MTIGLGTRLDDSDIIALRTGWVLATSMVYHVGSGAAVGWPWPPLFFRKRFEIWTLNLQRYCFFYSLWTALSWACLIDATILSMYIHVFRVYPREAHIKFSYLFTLSCPTAKSFPTALYQRAPIDMVANSIIVFTWTSRTHSELSSSTHHSGFLHHSPMQCLSPNQGSARRFTFAHDF